MAEAWRRDDGWLRRKAPGEVWPRYTAEVPPEIARLLNEAQRVSLGINVHGNDTRANLVRAGLRLYLEAVHPEPPPAVDVTATDVIDVPALPSGPPAAP